MRRRGKVYEVTARLRNLTKEALVVEMPDRCPQGPAIFHGLRDGYDYYVSCMKGACMGGRPPIRHSIPAGQTIDVESIEINPVDGNCNTPLEPGSYRLSFAFQTPLRLCGGPTATLEVRPPATKPPPPAKPTKPCPPMPTCGIACPGGEFARDADGCSTCGCVKNPLRATPIEPGR